MPVNRKKMKAMKEEYGPKKGKQVYYATENKMKKSKPMGYAKGGMVKSNCGASMKPTQTRKGNK